MKISRRQFLRACMYAAPAAIVAPKAIAYFLPPRIDLEPLPVSGPEWAYRSVDSDIIKLIQRRMNEACRTYADGIAHQVYATSPQEWAAAADGMHGVLFANEKLEQKHFMVMGIPVVLDPEMPPGHFQFRAA